MSNNVCVTVLIRHYPVSLKDRDHATLATTESMNVEMVPVAPGSITVARIYQNAPVQEMAFSQAMTSTF